MEYQAGARSQMELIAENAAVKHLLVAAVRQNRELATGLEQVTAFQTSYDVFSDAQQFRIHNLLSVLRYCAESFFLTCGVQRHSRGHRYSGITHFSPVPEDSSTRLGLLVPVSEWFLHRIFYRSGTGLTGCRSVRHCSILKIVLKDVT
jgi:hypothetical protein